MSANNGGTFSCSDYSFSGINALDGETDNATATIPYPSPDQTCPGIVPVTLISFSLQIIDKSKVQINWLTSTELNNDLFEVQHSIDGLDFVTISRIDGVGTSFKSHTYRYVHENPNFGRNYYRLKQVDNNGNFKIYPPQTISLTGKKLTSEIYPTLATEVLNINSTGQFSNDDSKLEIYNLEGILVQTKNLILDGLNQINIASLSVGTYILRIETNGIAQTFRFFKI